MRIGGHFQVMLGMETTLLLEDVAHDVTMRNDCATYTTPELKVQGWESHHQLVLRDGITSNMSRIEEGAVCHGDLNIQRCFPLAIHLNL